MRTVIIALALCYVVDAVVFDGVFLDSAASTLKAESFKISSGVQRWMSQSIN